MSFYQVIETGTLIYYSTQRGAGKYHLTGSGVGMFLSVELTDSGKLNFIYKEYDDSSENHALISIYQLRAI